MNQLVKAPFSSVYAQVQLLCQQLKMYGYTAAIAAVARDNIEYPVRVTRDGETCLDATLRLDCQNDTMSKLGELCRVACFEAAIDELRPRMMLVGWSFTVEKERGQTPSLCVREAGKTTRYSCTYSDLTALRRDLNLAEVAFLMETHMSLFTELGWNVVIRNDAYIVQYDDSSITVEFGDVKQARKAVDTARADKASKDMTDII